MTDTGHSVVDRMTRGLSSGDVDALLDLYASGARIVSFAGEIEGHEAIRELISGSLRAHGSYEVLSVDQFRDAGDLIMWDASVRTANGILQTTHVVVLDADGAIRIHVPGIRGYWGM